MSSGSLQYTGRSGRDRGNQIASYATTIQKRIKWSQKLAMHFLIGTSIVNAWHCLPKSNEPEDKKIRATNKKILNGNGKE